LIEWINALPNRVVSIDIPSGLQADLLAPQYGAIVQADITLTIEIPKRSMLFPENDCFVGRMVIVPLGLDTEYEINQPCDWYFNEDREVAPLLLERVKYSHRGIRGNLQVVAGSAGMMGACMLVSYAAMRTGVGKVTACVVDSGLQAMQTAVPEVVCKAGYGSTELERFEQIQGSTAMVVGPGMGTGNGATSLLNEWLNTPATPAIIDADALTVISREGWLSRLPLSTILTPHVGEFDRLFGKHENHFDRLETQINKSKELGIFIVLKGAHTRVTTPEGQVYVNSTGNPGMATAGSGDVLSGMIGSLLAQGYKAQDAALLGVYMHGLAGDLAAEARSMDAVIARDIIEFIGDAFTHLRGLIQPRD
jgi:NAD(P)H-hydrate epimerase